MNVRNKGLSILLTITMIFTGLNISGYGTINVHAEKSTAPDVTKFATPDQLVKGDNFALHEDMGSGSAQKVYFGRNSESAQPWYIAGSDGDNRLVLMCDPEKPLATKVFNSDTADKSYGDIAVYANHYGASELRQYLTEAGGALSGFTSAEQGLMLNTEICTEDTKNNIVYSNTDKLYAAYGDFTNNESYITVGSNSADNLNNGIKVDLINGPYSQSGVASWLRAPSHPNDNENNNGYALVAAPGRHFDGYVVGGSLSVVPVFALDLSKVLFASAAQAGQTGTDFDSQNAMTLRLIGNDVISSTVSYTANKVTVTKAEADSGLYLCVQGNNGTDWVYSKEITENNELLAINLKEELGITDDIDFTKCKIWIETTDSSKNLTYAVMATEGESTKIPTVEISDITAPVAGGSLDLEAVCNTVGVKTTKPAVSYTENGNAVTGELGYLKSYKATMELEADAGHDYVFTSATKANVNGKEATVAYSSETGKLTVTYTFKTPAKSLSNVYYVTPDELMNGFCLDGENDFYGILNYGRATGGESLYKESMNSGDALQWYIAGRDSANTKDNIVLLSAEEFGTYNAKDDDDYRYSYLRYYISGLLYSGRFSGAERNYMMSSYLSNTGVSEVLYAPYAEKHNSFITLGGQENLIVSSSNLPEMTMNLLTRHMYMVNSYRWFQVHIGKGGAGYGISGKDSYLAAFDLDISDVLFASAASPAQETTSFATAKASFSNDTTVNEEGDRTYVYKDYNLYTLRMKNKGKKIFSDVKRRDNAVVVTKGQDVADLYLYVQDDDSVYSKKIDTEEGTVTTVNLSDMTGIDSLEASTTKIWLETTEDYITYAKKATTEKEVSSVAITEIDAPDIGTKLDETAACSTDGILETAPSVAWKNGNETVSGSVEYNTAYTARITLSPDTEQGYSFADDVSVTVNGKVATSVEKNEDNTLTVTYTFPATGRKERTITITDDTSEHIYCGEPMGIVTTPTISEGEGSVRYTYYLDEACTEMTYMSEPMFMEPGYKPVKPGTYWVKATVSADGIYDSATSNAAKFVIKKRPITSISIKDQTIEFEEEITQYSRSEEQQDVISVSGLCNCDYIASVTLKPSTSQITNNGEIAYTGLTIKSYSFWNMSWETGEDTDVTDYYDFTDAQIKKGKLEITGVFDISRGNLVIHSDSYTIGEENVPYTTDYVITGTTNQNKIKVESGSHKITIQDLNIDLSECGDSKQYRPIDFETAEESELVIKGDNTVKGGGDCPGINVPAKKKLVISGDGTLNAYGGRSWPGIGTCGDGNIEIQSGIINAYGGSKAAGIGGSQCQNGGKIVITGGEVTAVGGEGNHEIGSGVSLFGNYDTKNTDITISGGKVAAFTAVSGSKIKVGNMVMTMKEDSKLEFQADKIVKIHSGSVELSGDATGYGFIIPENSGDVTIELNGFINDSTRGWCNSLSIENGSNLKLVLTDETENIIYGGPESSAIRVNESASLTIEGNGTLKAGVHNGSCAAYCAVIGSGYCGNYGNITINGGVIYADSPMTYRAAAIGTARWNSTEGTSNGTITLNGGEIHANLIGGVTTAEYSTIKGNGGAIVYTDEIKGASSEFVGVIVNSSGDYNIVGDTYHVDFDWTDDFQCSCTYVHLGEESQTVVDTKDCEITSETVQTNCEQEGTTTYTATATFGDTIFTDTKKAVVPAKEHKYKKELVEDATCTKDGYYQKVCEECGYVSLDGWEHIDIEKSGLKTDGRVYQVSSDGTMLFSKEIYGNDEWIDIFANIERLSDETKDNYANAERYEEYATVLDYTAGENVRKMKLQGHFMDDCTLLINGKVYERQSEIEVDGNHLYIQMKPCDDMQHGLLHGMCIQIQTFTIQEDLKIPALRHDFANYTSNKDATYEADGTETATCTREGCDGTNTRVRNGSKLTDVKKPELTITLGENAWKAFANKVTFGLFFKETQTAQVTATDIENLENNKTVDRLASVFYYVSEKELSESDLGTVNWVSIENNGRITLDPGKKYIVYAKAVDKSGNTAYASSAGVIVDSAAPVVEGIEGGDTYCEKAVFTVTDLSLQSVTDNGTGLTPTDGTYQIEGDNKSHRIVAKDDCGNETTVTITVNKNHSFAEYTSNNDATCTEDGTKTATCTYCQETDTVVDKDSKLGHDFTAKEKSDATLVHEATCTVPAEYYYSCTRCGEVGTKTFTDGTVDADAHTYKDGVCKDCGTAFSVMKDGLIYTVIVKEEKDTTTGITNKVAETVTVKNSDGETVTTFAVSVKATDEVADSENATTGTNADGTAKITVTIPGTILSGDFTGTVTAIEKNGFKNVEDVTEIVIPESVTEIGASAFAGSDITEITIPKNVTKIDSGAFKDCEQLTQLTFEGATAPTISEDAFENMENIAIHVPDEAKENYYEQLGDLISIEEPHTHTYGAWTKNDAETHKKVCSECDDCITEPHSWDEGVITLAATQETEGIKTYQCTVCGETKTETIAKLPKETNRPEKTGQPEKTSQPGETSKPDETSQPEKTSQPGETSKPEETSKPDETSQPDETNGPEITNRPEVTNEPEMTNGPEVTNEPEETSKPEATSNPEATNKPETTDELEEADDPEELDEGTEITNAATKAKFIVVDPVEIDEDDEDGTPAVSYKASIGEGQTKITIPDTIMEGGTQYRVVAIEANAFKNNTKLVEVTIGKNIKTIGSSVFDGCKNLNKVSFKKTSQVKIIGKNAFRMCSSLTKVTIPKSVVTIGDSAFEGCSKLTSVSIQSGSELKIIGKNAFKNCVALKKFTVPENVTAIGSGAFYGCKSLKMITIQGKRLKTVKKDAFKGIKSTARIKVPAKKFASYKKLLKGKGQGKKVKIIK